MASNLGVGGPCCFAGHIAEGTPEGVFKELGGVRTYVAAPKDVVPKKAIILFTDVFGVGPPNSQLMADKFASEGGFLVAVPDLFGDSAPSPATMDRMLKLAGLGDPPAKSVWEHLWRYGRNAYYLPLCVAAIVPFALANFPWTKKEPLAQAVYNDLKANHGIQHFGVVGYCYGGGFCLKWASEADKVDAFVVAHTQIKVPDSLEKLEKPGLIICAERDFTQSEKVLLFQGFQALLEFQASPTVPNSTSKAVERGVQMYVRLSVMIPWNYRPNVAHRPPHGARVLPSTSPTV